MSQETHDLRNHSAENCLLDDPDKYWIGISFILDIGCVQDLSTITLYNNQQSSIATRKFEISLKLEEAEIWEKLPNLPSLADPEYSNPDQQRITIVFPKRKLQYVKFEVLSAWEQEGGLKFFSIA